MLQFENCYLLCPSVRALLGDHCCYFLIHTVSITEHIKLKSDSNVKSAPAYELPKLKA